MSPIPEPQRPRWAPETIPDYTPCVAQLFEHAFNFRLQLAIPDVEELELLLPEILETDERSLNTFETICGSGYLASYQFILPIVLEQFGFIAAMASVEYYRHRQFSEEITERIRAFQVGVEEAFGAAAELHHDRIADSVLAQFRNPGVCVWVDKVKGKKPDTTRLKFLAAVSKWGTRNDQHRIPWSLRNEWFSEEHLGELLFAAVDEELLDLAKAYLDNLTSKQREALYSRRRKTNAEKRWKRKMETNMADAMITILKGEEEYVDFLEYMLRTYLDARLGHFMPTDRSEYEPLDHLTRKHLFNVFDRAETFEFIQRKLPPRLRRVMFDRLALPDEEEETERIEVFAGGGSVPIYRDVLCYWSKKFRDLPANETVFQLDAKFSRWVLPELYAFVHRGDDDCMTKGNIDLYKEVSRMAEVLEIKKLKDIVGELWWKEASTVGTGTATGHSSDADSDSDTPTVTHLESASER